RNFSIFPRRWPFNAYGRPRLPSLRAPFASSARSSEESLAVDVPVSGSTGHSAANPLLQLAVMSANFVHEPERDRLGHRLWVPDRLARPPGDPGPRPDAVLADGADRLLRLARGRRRGSGHVRRQPDPRHAEPRLRDL